MSAFRSSCSLVIPGSSKAMPMLPAGVEVRVPCGAATRSDSRIRAARCVMSSRDSTSSMSMANSSPPRRAAVSSGRRQPERSVATRFNRRSPSPCPRLSFTVLKSSRSMNSTARCEPVWSIRARAWSSRSWNNALLARPVSESWNTRYSSSSSRRMRSVTSRKLQTLPTIVSRTSCGLELNSMALPSLNSSVSKLSFSGLWVSSRWRARKD